MLNIFEWLVISYERCPRCGEGELQKTKDGYVVCSECGYEEYDG